MQTTIANYRVDVVDEFGEDGVVKFRPVAWFVQEDEARAYAHSISPKFGPNPVRVVHLRDLATGEHIGLYKYLS